LLVEYDNPPDPESRGWHFPETHQYRPEVRPYPPEKNRRTDIKETDRGPENGKM